MLKQNLGIRSEKLWGYWKMKKTEIRFFFLFFFFFFWKKKTYPNPERRTICCLQPIIASTLLFNLKRDWPSNLLDTSHYSLWWGYIERDVLYDGFECFFHTMGIITQSSSLGNYLFPFIEGLHFYSVLSCSCWIKNKAIWSYLFQMS